LGTSSYSVADIIQTRRLEFSLCTKVPHLREELSRKGAKAQSATAYLKGFLCAFAALRETNFSRSGSQMHLSNFVQSRLNSELLAVTSLMS
jgi:hypothetical protein